MTDDEPLNDTLDDADLPAGMDDGLCAAFEPRRSDESAEPEDAPAGEGSVRSLGDRYRVDGEIGSGGIGIVLRGRDRELNREVALKLLRKRHAENPNVRQRFVEEAQVGGQLQHPGIVPVYDSGTEQDGSPYFAMKLVRGKTLAELLKGRSDPGQDRPEFLRIFEQVCQAVGYAHSRGVVHRDLKPANVMVGAFGEVQVVDWGLAKVRDAEGSETPREKPGDAIEKQPVRTVRTESSDGHSIEGTILGTPAYMPPEQARGDVNLIDPRSDVFSLGAILCEILSGSPPYSGESAEIQLEKAREAELPQRRLEACGAEPELVAIALRALAQDRGDRPRDAGELAGQVREHLDSVERRAREAEIEARTARVRVTQERRARRFAMGLVVALLVAFGVSIAAFLRVSEAEQGERAKAEELRQLLYRSQVRQAHQGIESDSPEPVKPILDACAEDLRGWEWRHLNWRADRSEITLELHRGAVTDLDVSEDGRTLVSASADNTIAITATGGDRPVQVIESPDPPAAGRGFTAVRLNPSGTALVTGHASGAVRLFDPESGTMLRLLGEHLGPVEAVAFSDDGRWLASGGRDGFLKIYSTDSWDRLHEVGGTFQVLSLDFEDSGRRLLAGHFENVLSLWNPVTGEGQSIFNGNKSVVYDARFEPGGRHVASVGGNRELWRYDTSGLVEPGRILQQFEVSRETPRRIRFVDSATAAVAGDDGLIALVDVEEGRRISVLRGHESPIHSLVVDRSREVLWSGDRQGRVKCWSLHLDTGVARRRHSNILTALAFEPGGRRLLFGGPAPAVVAWDVDTFATEVPLLSNHDPVVDLAIAQDGTLVVGHGGAEGLGWWQAREPSGQERWRADWTHGRWVSDVAVHDGGKLVAAVGSGGGLEIRATDDGSLVASGETGDAGTHCLSFVPGGELLATGGNRGLVQLWDTSSAEARGEFEAHPGGVLALAAVDQHRLLSSGADGRVLLWDLLSGEIVQEFRGHSGPVRALAVHPQGRRVASGGDDAAVRIWQLDTSAELLTLRGHGGAVRKVSFNPDGTNLASVGEDHQVLLWESVAPASGWEQRAISHQAEELVESLFLRLGLRAEMSQFLEEDADLDPTVRRRALGCVDMIGENTDLLSNRVADITLRPGRIPEVYRGALRDAEASVQWYPTHPSMRYLQVRLGEACYRVGEYERAVEILERAREGFADDAQEPSMLVFAAMALYRTGWESEARDTLADYEALVAEMSRRRDLQVYRDLLAEAREVIQE